MKTKKIVIALLLFTCQFAEAQAWSCTTIGGGCYRNGATGIGTNGTPTYMLDVRSASQGSGISYIYNGGITNTSSMFQLGNTYNNKYWQIVLDGTTAGHLSITDGSNPPQLFLHGSNKNIGIGTTTPGSRLQVEDFNQSNSILTAKANFSTGGGNSIVSDVNYDNTYALKVIDRNVSTSNIPKETFWVYGNGQTVISTNTNDAFIIQDNATTGSPTNFKVQKSGQVNIGSQASSSNQGFCNINLDGSQFPKAIEVFDQYTGLVNFSVRSNGNVWCRELNIKVASVAFPDFVFKNNYDLMSLESLRGFIQKNHHLPNIPTAQEVEKEGLNLGDLSLKQLQKIEELTLYILELEKRINVLENKK